MAKLYLKLLLARRKNFEEVPEIYRAEIKNLLAEKIKSGDSVAMEFYEKYFGGDQLD